ncbi:hypothetical protein ACHAXR_001883, partial [Thalassiosira sp. AJA248-18]
MEHYARLAGIAKSRKLDENIASIIDALGLTEQKNTIVGDIFRRGLSGGQKRRLSIGLEALSNPKNLYLDEPTSGLDSESALAVLKFLKSYASAGRRVVLTIHQPSSFIWELIDRVVLLSKGALVYQGKRSSTTALCYLFLDLYLLTYITSQTSQYSGPRNRMEDFFEYANTPTPPHYNPADHYIASVNTEFSLCEKSPDEWHATFMDWCQKFDARQVELSQKHQSEYEMKSQRVLNVPDEEGQDEAESYLDFLNFLKTTHRSSVRRPTIIHEDLTAHDLHSFRTNGLRAMVELIRRYILNLIYNPGILGTRVAMYVMLALIIGALFWNLGDLTTFTSINSRIALLFYCVAFFVFMSVAVLPFTVMERGIITKEVRNSYYHPIFYQ